MFINIISRGSAFIRFWLARAASSESFTSRSSFCPSYRVEYLFSSAKPYTYLLTHFHTSISAHSHMHAYTLSHSLPHIHPHTNSCLLTHSLTQPSLTHSLIHYYYFTKLEDLVMHKPQGEDSRAWLRDRYHSWLTNRYVDEAVDSSLLNHLLVKPELYLLCASPR